MLGFGLCSTSDDQLSDLSDESWLKCEKRPPMSSKNKMLIFILCSTSDDRPSDLSDESWIKMWNNEMLFQLGSSVLSVWVFCCFSLGLLLFQSGSSVISVRVFCCSSLGLLYAPAPDGKVGIRVTKKFRFFRFMFNKFQPKDNSVQSLLHLLAMQLILWWAMYQLVHPTLLQSIAFRLWQIYLLKIVTQCGQLSSSPPGSAAHLWWAMMIGWVIWVMKVNWNVKKAPLSHQKMKC